MTKLMRSVSLRFSYINKVNIVGEVSEISE